MFDFIHRVLRVKTKLNLGLWKCAGPTSLSSMSIGWNLTVGNFGEVRNCLRTYESQWRRTKVRCKSWLGFIEDSRWVMRHFKSIINLRIRQWGRTTFITNFVIIIIVPRLHLHVSTIRLSLRQCTDLRVSWW